MDIVISVVVGFALGYLICLADVRDKLHSDKFKKELADAIERGRKTDEAKDSEK